MTGLSSFSYISLSQNFSSINFTKFFIFSFSSVASPANTSHSHCSFTNYLINTFGFSETQALSASSRFWKRWAKTPEKIESTVDLLRKFGFSNTHIRNTVQVTPQILFADVNKTLEPKLKFFEELGFTGSDLGFFISKNTSLLTDSLDRRLIPNSEILKEILSDDHKALIRILLRCKWLLSRDPKSFLLPNISLLQRHGIVGSQLSMLLKLQPSLFVTKESNLRNLVCKVEEIGFSSGSRMLVHGLYTLSYMSSENLERKFDVFRNFGFSQEECLAMFRKAPGLPRVSVEKLRIGIEFFTKNVGFERAILINKPTLLMHSMEKRVIPRYIVLEILKSKKLLKKNPSFINVVQLPEDEFLDKFISKFRENAEELLVAYKGGVLDVESSEDTLSQDES